MSERHACSLAVWSDAVATSIVLVGANTSTTESGGTPLSAPLRWSPHLKDCPHGRTS